MKPTAYPSINEITMVIPTKITDTGIYVKLIEYNDIEGLIILSELSKSRIRSIGKVVPIGKKFPAFVSVCDNKTKNITLSKKAVTATEKIKCEANYKNLKYIYDIMFLFFEKMKKNNLLQNPINDQENPINEQAGTIIPSRQCDITTLYEKFIWSLGNDPEFLLLALKSASKNFNKVYGNKLEDIDHKWIDIFQEILSHKFKSKDIILEAILDICCFETGGINIIKNALLSGLEMSNNEYPFKLKLVKAPYYSITLKTLDQEAGINLLNIVIEKIKNELEKNNANIKIVKFPEIIVDKEFEPKESESSNSD